MPQLTKLNAETSAQILDSLAIGATYNDASEMAGVTSQTFRNWMRRGEAARSGIYFEFFGNVKRAEATARIKFTRALYLASGETGGWRAALEFLKRRDRLNWGDTVDVTSAGAAISTVVAFDLKRLSDAELESLEKLVEKAEGRGNP